MPQQGQTRKRYNSSTGTYTMSTTPKHSAENGEGTVTGSPRDLVFSARPGCLGSAGMAYVKALAHARVLAAAEHQHI